MSVQNPDRLVTKQDLNDYHNAILPYLNGSGGGGGHTIEDSTGTALTQRDVLQFSDSFAPTDDSTDEVTKIALNKLNSGDMADVVTPLPSVQPRWKKYSTDEQLIGEWIDGSYLYEKTINLGNSFSSGSNSINHGIANLDKVINAELRMYYPYQNNIFYITPYSLSVSGTLNDWGLNLNYIDNTTVSFICGTERTSNNIYITIQYTKTTS